MKDSRKSSSARIVIQHQSGSKANQIDEFPVNQFSVITFGRSSTSDISFDPDLDDVVSREHGKINIIDKDPLKIVITDLGSSNGTFVNKEEVKGMVDLFPGDIIQLGSNGPEFQFDVHPLQKDYMKKTRLLETYSAEEISKQTRVSKVPDSIPEVKEPAPVVKTGVGKETVERMVRHSEKKTSSIWLIGVIAGLLLLAAVGYYFWPETPEVPVVEVPELPEKFKTLTPTEIASANKDKVVFIEVGWKLTHTRSGEDVYHFYSNGQAAYFQHSDGTIEPFLLPGSNKTQDSRLISGLGTGSGFVVSDEGFILTNRHVAGGWFTRYNFPQGAFPGILFRLNDQGKMERVNNTTVRAQHLENWVPGNAKFFGDKPLSGKILKGENMYLDVTFDGNDSRIPATVARISNKHDVTMIKIAMPESISSVTIADRHEEIKPGDAVVVMGYPGISPDEVIIKGSQDVFNRNPQIIKIPSTTVTNGNIGRVIGRNRVSGSDMYFSEVGDVYQLTISATGAGNSGGPMFDDHGNVIGIFFASQNQNGARISFAVPIKYGLELMGRKQVYD